MKQKMDKKVCWCCGGSGIVTIIKKTFKESKVDHETTKTKPCIECRAPNAGGPLCQCLGCLCDGCQGNYLQCDGCFRTKV